MNVNSAKQPKVLPISINGDAFRHNFPPGVPGRASPTIDVDRRGRRRSHSRNTMQTSTTKTYQQGADSGSHQQGPGPTGSYQQQPQTGRDDLRVDDCLVRMIKFVKEHDLMPIIGRNLSDEELKVQLRPQAEIASRLPQQLGFLDRERTMQLAVMSLYDLAVLVDDSISMEFEESGKRKEALKDVLDFLARMYGAVSGGQRGIRAIRFLNGSDEDDQQADNLKERDEIDRVINEHVFEGVTRIGTGLMQKILKPFVFSEERWVKGTIRKLQQMERPLLVMVITDGAVEGEPPKRLEQAINSVVESLQNAGIGTKAVAFQFARVGSDEGAKEFLRYLDDESRVKDYVDTLAGGDLMDIMESKDKAHQQRAIKLLLGPIDPGYDQLDGEDTTLNEFYAGDEDFDDEEDF